MKKSILITLMLIPFLGFAQTTKPIEGFLGIKFGSSKAVVMAAMKAKGAVYSLKNSKKGIAVFEKVKLGHREALTFIVRFTNDMAYSAVFNFVPENEPQTIEYYYGLVNDINAVYGTGSPTSNFKSPFKDGDGNEIVALRQGYATMFNNWKSGGKTILVSIENDLVDDNHLSVVALYQDDKLSDQAEAGEKAKEKSDY